MSVTVIIPTYNRDEILRKVLTGYAKQTGDHQMIEVLVVDDGSKDHTASVVEECSRQSPVPVRYLHQENSGLAAARNHAIREARAELLLFGDDDIIPSPGMVAEHVSWHRVNPDPKVGVLGFVTWARELRPTPFMEWSGLHGPQFSFAKFEPGKALDFRFGYFCNTSVKTAFLKDHGIFNESFRSYGWEDLELSYRLTTKGYTLLYHPKAVGYHYKFERFENTRRRVESTYRSLPVFAKTEAGERFLELWRAGNTQKPGGMKALRSKLLKPIKACAMPLFRPLADTRIPLPAWLYDSLFYYYVTPFSRFVATLDQAREGAPRHEFAPSRDPKV